MIINLLVLCILCGLTSDDCIMAIALVVVSCILVYCRHRILCKNYCREVYIGRKCTFIIQEISDEAISGEIILGDKSNTRLKAKMSVLGLLRNPVKLWVWNLIEGKIIYGKDTDDLILVVCEDC